MSHRVLPVRHPPERGRELVHSSATLPLVPREHQRTIKRRAVALASAEHLDQTQVGQRLAEHRGVAERLSERDGAVRALLSRTDITEMVLAPDELSLERNADARVGTRLLERPRVERR